MVTVLTAGVDPTTVVKVRLAGDTAIRGRARTVTLTCFVTPSDEAVITALPANTPVTTPTPSTVAIFVALDDQDTVRAVIGCPLALFGVAVSVARSPTLIEIVGGLTSSDATGTG
jgi:hypothetical protein